MINWANVRFADCHLCGELLEGEAPFSLCAECMGRCRNWHSLHSAKRFEQTSPQPEDDAPDVDHSKWWDDYWRAKRAPHDRPITEIQMAEWLAYVLANAPRYRWLKRDAA